MKWHRFGRGGDKKGPDGKFGWLNGILIVFVNGSNSVSDWRHNFTLRRERLVGGNVRANRSDVRGAVQVIADLSKQISEADEVVLMGVSRGFAVAEVIAIFLASEKEVHLLGWAGKRTGNYPFVRRLERVTTQLEHFAVKGDVIPFLPFWYAQTEIEWQGPWKWPWAAHIKSARRAAQLRHELSK